MKVVDGKFNEKKGPDVQEFLEYLGEFVAQLDSENTQLAVVINSGEFLSVLSNYTNIAEAHFDLSIIADGLLHGSGGGDAGQLH